MEKSTESIKRNKAPKNQAKRRIEKMPTVAITDLDPIEIPHHFSLTHCQPTEFELTPRETEKASLPPHLRKLDYRY
jgi:hypothetical protein